MILDGWTSDHFQYLGIPSVTYFLTENGFLPGSCGLLLHKDRCEFE